MTDGIADGEEALTEREFDAAMSTLAPFEHRPHIAAAVSGGGDSLALVLLADRWARRRGGRLSALTVDHRLRAASTAEARRVGKWLAARGIPHTILTWHAAKPATGIQATARAHRYALLEGWCRAHGVLHLLLGHHNDDQAETVVLRLAAGSGIDGLSAMDPVRETGHVRLLRPLLAFRRARLEALLRREEQPWLSDPSNRDGAFARVRVRATLAGQRRGGLDPRPFAEAAAIFRVARADLRRAAAGLIARGVAPHSAGFCRIDCAAMRAAPDEIAARALAAVLAAVGGARWPPALAAVERVLPLVRGLTPPGRAATLSRCRLHRQGESIVLCREQRALPAPLWVAAGQGLHWDGRFRVRTNAAGWLTPLGPTAWRRLVTTEPCLRRSAIPHPARMTLPALTTPSGRVRAVAWLYPAIAEQPPTAEQPFLEAIFEPSLTLSGYGYFLAGDNGAIM